MSSPGDSCSQPSNQAVNCKFTVPPYSITCAVQEGGYVSFNFDVTRIVNSTTDYSGYWTLHTTRNYNNGDPNPLNVVTGTCGPTASSSQISCGYWEAAMQYLV